ncbi:MAG TPA: hypothetical protein VFY92_04395 [Hyphomicrobiaceae bacterium]|nr:hypothetical protein [Hyphomicrobiaceae bacterium]
MIKDQMADPMADLLGFSLQCSTSSAAFGALLAGFSPALKRILVLAAQTVPGRG